MTKRRHHVTGRGKEGWCVFGGGGGFQACFCFGVTGGRRRGAPAKEYQRVLNDKTNALSGAKD